MPPSITPAPVVLPEYMPPATPQCAALCSTCCSADTMPATPVVAAQPAALLADTALAAHRIVPAQCRFASASKYC